MVLSENIKLYKNSFSSAMKAIKVKHTIQYVCATLNNIKWADGLNSPNRLIGQLSDVYAVDGVANTQR